MPITSNTDSRSGLGDETVVESGVDVAVNGGELVELGGQLLDVWRRDKMV
jgi:hypothetical protein